LDSFTQSLLAAVAVVLLVEQLVLDQPDLAVVAVVELPQVGRQYLHLVLLVQVELPLQQVVTRVLGIW
jgi:hypothetical protein